MPLLRGDRKRDDKKRTIRVWPKNYHFPQKKLEFCFVCYVITMETHPLVD